MAGRGGRGRGGFMGFEQKPLLVDILMKVWEIMVTHEVHQINIMSEAAALLICVRWLLGHMTSDSFLLTPLIQNVASNKYPPKIITKIQNNKKNNHVLIYPGSQRDTDLNVRKHKQGSRDVTRGVLQNDAIE